MIRLIRFIGNNKRYSLACLVFFIYLLVINRASYLSIYVECIFIISFWVIYKPLSCSTYNGRLRIFVLLSFLYFVLGIAHGNQFDYMLTDFMHITPISILILGAPKFKKDFIDNQLEGYKRIMPILVIFYFLIFYYMGYSWVGSTDARFAYNQDSKLSLFAPLTPLAFFVFVLAYNKIKANKIVMISLVIGILANLHIGFTTQTKTAFLGPIIILVLKLFINDSFKTKLKYIIIFLVAYWGIIYFINNYMPELSYLTDAFSDKFDTSNDSNTSRMDETLEYLSKCNVLQILLGKGFGGEKIFNGEDFIGGVNMLHMGWGFLMMKGGVLLLIMIYYPLLWIIYHDLKSKHYIFTIIAIYFLIKDQMHTNFTSWSGVFLYWFLVYTRYYYRNYFLTAQSYEIK